MKCGLFRRSKGARAHLYALNTDSITFKNCAPEGKGMSSNNGVLWAASEFVAVNLVNDFIERLRRVPRWAESQERKMRSSLL